MRKRIAPMSSGFTLVELVMVIILIGLVLYVVAISALRNATAGVRRLLLSTAIGLRSAVALSVITPERQQQAVKDLCAT